MISADQFIIDLIIGMIILMTTFLFTIIYVRFSYVSTRKWKADITRIFEDLLAKYVNCKDPKEAAFTRNRILKLANSKEKKQILLSLIIKLYNNFTGQYSEIALAFYSDLKLYKLSLRKLKKRAWHYKIEGIVELGLMKYPEASEKITVLLSHENVNVRRNAKVALVDLEKVEGIKKLMQHPSEMSNWTFLSILSIMQRSPLKVKMADIAELRSSDSESIRLLADNLEKYALTT